MRSNIRHVSNSSDTRAETLPKKNNRDVESRKNCSSRRAYSSTRKKAGTPEPVETSLIKGIPATTGMLTTAGTSEALETPVSDKTSTATGTSATAETLSTAVTSRMSSAVKTAAVAGTPTISTGHNKSLEPRNANGRIN